ncbi:hypothetical protein nbrc107696_10110 [Gordonia spumicola]|uniref:Uncharacterized protein n=1 Tax=Gordonia spumicola TaxID=589161 RepID=A0A7I9V571_9ACTN|nr:hypothetical protein nbrc107696_10110 [Gordonia spumicola]
MLIGACGAIDPKVYPESNDRVDTADIDRVTADSILRENGISIPRTLNYHSGIGRSYGFPGTPDSYMKFVESNNSVGGELHATDIGVEFGQFETYPCDSTFIRTSLLGRLGLDCHGSPFVQVASDGTPPRRGAERLSGTTLVVDTMDGEVRLYIAIVGH